MIKLLNTSITSLTMITICMNPTLTILAPNNEIYILLMLSHFRNQTRIHRITYYQSTVIDTDNDEKYIEEDQASR